MEAFLWEVLYNMIWLCKIFVAFCAAIELYLTGKFEDSVDVVFHIMKMFNNSQRFFGGGGSSSGPVLCVVMSSNGEQCYSGGTDGLIHGWNITNPNIDPYDSYGTLLSHTTEMICWVTLMLCG